MTENMLQTTQDNALQTLDAAQVQNFLLDSKVLNQLYKVARMYSNSKMVPDVYQNQPDNCFLAIEIAARLNISPLLVMQNLYIVHGKPSWAGQFCIALVNGCRQFDQPLEFVFVGERDSLDWGCYAITQRNGKTVRSVTVDMNMAKNEGWLQKKGSKWVTMPEQMMMYRAAAFFARVHCPNVLMGFSTVEESEDIAKEEPAKTVIRLNNTQQEEDPNAT